MRTASEETGIDKPLVAFLAALPETDRRRFIENASADEVAELLYIWREWARPSQLPPAGDWRVWLLLAGRGFGKTRAGAEYVRARVKQGARRIALVGPTFEDARDIMVEGDSGILAVSPPPRDRAMCRRSAASCGPTAPSLRSLAPMSRAVCAARSTIPPGATSWRRGAIPKPGTC